MSIKRGIAALIAFVFMIGLIFGSLPFSTQKVSAASKVVTLTMFSADASAPSYHPDIFSSAIGQEITRKTGVRLKVEHFVGMDQATKVSLMLASGDMPDLVYGSGQHGQFIQSKALIPLDDYINKYGQWTKQAYSSADLKKLRQADGHIYFLSYSRGEVAPNSNGEGVWAMIDALKEANWPRLRYWNEFISFMKNYVKKHPTYKGMPTIGMSFVTEGSRFYVIQNPPRYLAGFQDDGSFIVDPKTYEAKQFYTSVYSYKFYRDLNALWQEGLVDKEAFVQSYDQWAAKIAQGRVVTSFARPWHYTSAFNTLTKNKEDGRILVPFAIVYEGVKKAHYIAVSSIGTRDGISITKKCKNPVVAFKFLDQLLQPDIQKLMFWGIKGRDYLVDKKGKMYRTQAMIDKAKDPVYQKQEGLGYFNVFPRWYQKLPDGNYVKPDFDPDIAYMGWAPAQKQVLDAYKAKTFIEPPFADPPEPSKWGFAWEINVPPERQNDVSVASQKVDDLTRKYIPQLVMAPKGKYDQVWNKYKADMEKTNYKVMEKFYTDAIKKRIADWY